MFPSEMVTPMAIAVARGHRTKPLERPADIIGEYVDYLCNSLLRRDYLNESDLKGG